MSSARLYLLASLLLAAMSAVPEICAQTSPLALQAQTSPVDSHVTQPYQAYVVAVSGKVTRIRDQQPWVLISGEKIPIQQSIITGSDGYARLEVAGGASFEIFSNSHVVFRQNAASAGDLLDVLAGRVRIHLCPTLGQPQQRIYTRAAVISTTHAPATVALAVDEDDTVRIDVIEGEVRVQHALLPRNDPVLVKAIDAILVHQDEPISRRVDRGALYRYTVKSLRDLWTAITPGHSSSHDGEPIEASAQGTNSGPPNRKEFAKFLGGTLNP